MGLAVKNHVLQLHSHVAVKLNSDRISDHISPQTKILNTAIPLLFTVVHCT